MVDPSDRVFPNHDELIVILVATTVAIVMDYTRRRKVKREVKKKEQKYWRKNSVFPIHLEGVAVLGNEIVTGSEAGTTGDFLNESLVNSPEADECNIQSDGIGIGTSTSHPQSNAPNMSGSQSTLQGSSRTRGRPRGAADDSRQSSKKKKKKEDDEVVTPLKEILVAMRDIANKARKEEDVCNAINALTDLDPHTRLLAKDFFSINNQLANVLLTEKDKDRPTVIKFYLDQLH